MKRVFMLTLTALLAFAAGTAPSAAGEQSAADRVGESRSCLAHSAIASSIVEDQQTIRFEMVGRRIYRNRLATACPELRQVAHGSSALAFELHGGSVCRGDLVRITDLGRARGLSLETAIACPLGSFERLPDRPGRRR